MFTSLLNTVCAYDPVGYGVPYNHLLFTDSLEPLVDVALQILIVTLDHDTTGGAPLEEGAVGDNLFINYLSRIHRDEGSLTTLFNFSLNANLYEHKKYDEGLRHRKLKYLLLLIIFSFHRFPICFKGHHQVVK